MVHLTSSWEISDEQLTALQFDSKTFNDAARIAVERYLPIYVPGDRILVIRKRDKALFQILGWVDEQSVRSQKQGNAR